MAIKRHKCECDHCIFPFGSGAPVCMRQMEITGDRKDLMQCNEIGCKHYERRCRNEKED